MAVGSNQVETYRGPVEPSRSQASGTPPAGTGEGGGLTAGQLALLHRQRRNVLNVPETVVILLALGAIQRETEARITAGPRS